MRAYYFLAAAAVLALDRLSKHWVVSRLSPDSVHQVIPHLFNLVYTRNRGVAFGMLSDSASRFQTITLIVFSATVIAILAAVIAMERQRRFTRSGIALALILGGAAGTLVDRLSGDGVVDFLDFYFRSYHWHTFNLADSAIVCGALLWATTLWTPKTAR